MTLEYTNRKGDRYYVYQGLTKTGKPKYFCSRKPNGTPVEALPAGFEIYEHPPSALVSIRKAKPSRLTALEREFVAEQIRTHAGIDHFMVDQTGDSFVVYLCDRDPNEVSRMMEMLGPVDQTASCREWILRNANYSPTFRLTLVDERQRLFHLERWCDRGSVDGWIPLMTQGRPLRELAVLYFRHLGQESYFNVM